MAGNKNSGRTVEEGYVVTLRLRITNKTPEWFVKFINGLVSNPLMKERTIKLTQGLMAGIAPKIDAVDVKPDKLKSLLNRKGKK